MSLGARINAYIEGRNEKQAAVAASWLERWRKQDGNPASWKDSTIISHLSRLVSDQEQGVRFFFEDLRRRELLLDILQVPSSEWPALVKLAEQALKPVEEPSRIIIDLMGWGLKMDVAFSELTRCFFGEGPFPIALVLLEDQDRLLPRGIEQLIQDKKVRLVSVKEAAEGRERLKALAGSNSLVVSTTPFEHFERWLAADFSDGRLQFEPPDGIELFRSQGHLPPLQPIPAANELSQWVKEDGSGSASSFSASTSGRQRHLQMRALRTEEGSAKLRMGMHERMRLARALGIAATSTAEERTEVLMTRLQDELGLPLTPAKPEDPKAYQAQARRRKIGPLALRTGSTVHLINVPDAKHRAEGRPWVHVHDIEPEPTSLSRLLAEVDGWNEADFLADPFLDGVLKKLTTHADERTAFLHARAGLLLTQALHPKIATPVTNWRAALEELVAGPPPAAVLRLRIEGELIDFAGGKRPAFAVTKERMTNAEKSSLPVLEQVPPVGDVLLRRDENPFVVGNKGVDERDAWSRRYPCVLLPLEEETARDASSWLDLFEGSYLKTNAWRENKPMHWDKYANRVINGNIEDWFAKKLLLPADVWHEADRELALIWLALRSALANPHAIPLFDGTVLLRLGSAFFAELRIIQRAASSDSKAVLGGLLLNVQFNDLHNYKFPEAAGCTLMEISELVPTHTVKGGYDFGARLPRSISLLGGRFYAEIRFRGSALFAGVPDSIPSAAASVARSESEKQAEEQRKRDDDDDDDYDD
ncbi:hypothetical protein [Corallococcus sp. 4LFB]|uniref:hypothetical protein n=1 Tax=Corallococcus sp. 4LFB TaxID=3383249 RepID=UPI00397640E7